MMTGSKRRLLLGLASVSAVILGAKLGFPKPGSASYPHDDLTSALLGIVSRHHAASIGRAYRQIAPDDASHPFLAQRIISPQSREWFLATTGQERTRFLARRIRADFARGRTVIVHGWILSITEARLCALSPPVA
jgi:hypothetical protein